MKSTLMTIILLLTLSVVLALIGCQAAPPTPIPGQEGTPSEQPVTVIPLTEPLAKRQAEVSGIAYGDYLIILPQYPDFFTSEGDGFLFAQPKIDILAFLDGTTSDPLEPIQIPFVAPGLSEQIDDFEGYEAIAFVRDRVFLTIETGRPIGYLLAGTLASDLSELDDDNYFWAVNYFSSATETYCQKPTRWQTLMAKAPPTLATAPSNGWSSSNTPNPASPWRIAHLSNWNRSKNLAATGRD